MQTEDLTAFFDTDELADAATIGAATVNGQFEREFAEVAGVEGYFPTFTCQTSAVSAVAIGATLVVGGVSYKILSKRPDGTGVSVLILEKV